MRTILVCALYLYEHYTCMRTMPICALYSIKYGIVKHFTQLGATTLRTTTFSRMTFCIKLATWHLAQQWKCDAQHSIMLSVLILSAILLSIVLLSLATLNALMPNVIVLSVVLPSVAAPSDYMTPFEIKLNVFSNTLLMFQVNKLECLSLARLFC
jgi:hypothetical protein